MVDYLTNFVKTGDPNGAGLPVWVPNAEGQNEVLRIGEGETRMGDVDIARLEEIMRTNKAEGER